MDTNKIVVAVDVGTTQISAVMGLVTNNIWSPIGTAVSKKTGTKRGIVVNTEEAAFGIREVINMLQNKTGHMVGKIYIAIGGQSLKTISDEFVLEDINANILNEHIEKLTCPSFDAQISTNDVIKKIYTQSYIIDGYNEIQNPAGHFVKSLTAKNRILVYNKQNIDNLKHSISKARLSGNVDFVSLLVLSDFLLSATDREKGVALIDMGGGTTDLIILHQKRVCYAVSIPLGGDLITKDIASELGIDFEIAEKIKIEHGQCLQCLPEEDVDITFSEDNYPQQIKLSRLSYIIQCRMDEILSIVNDQINQSNCRDYLQGGIILTGRASWMKGCIRMLDKMHQLKASYAEHHQLEDYKYKCSALALALLNKIDVDCSLKEIDKKGGNTKIESPPKESKKKDGNIFSVFKGLMLKDEENNDDLT